MGSSPLCLSAQPLVCLVHLVHLVYLDSLIHLVYPGSLGQPDERDRPDQPDEPDQFTSRISVLIVDEETSDRYATIRVALKKPGTPVAANDIWIAASAMQHGLPILTSDRDFQKISRVIVRLFCFCRIFIHL